MDKMDGMSMDIATINIEKIKELFPNAVTEGKIDFDMLRTILGDAVDESKEKYQFTWNGKAESIKLAQSPSSATLRPCKEKSKNWDTTDNIYIEGDNLEVLKQLQKTYFGKIKMIYIDPPYNTGNDFVYKDNFKDSIENYKEQTNQTQKSNPETSGRYHSDWLNMMYPRLLLARNLLKDDGLIFISIDDNEQGNLKKICDEIFGGEQFVAQFIWEKRLNRENRKEVSVRHDYILCYSKQHRDNQNRVFQLPMNEKALSNYSNPDSDPRGPWKSDPAHAQAGHGTPSQFYELKAPNGRIHSLPSGRCWLYTESEMKRAISENRIWFGRDGNGVPRIKTYLYAKERGLTPETMFFAKDASTNEAAKNKLKDLFDGRAVFETPKPIELIQQLLIIASRDDIILDFFAGSASTAHAVFRQNLDDKRHRKFIMVQLPEPVEENSEAFKAGYKTLCDIGEERIRRAGDQVKAMWEEEKDGEGLLTASGSFSTDIGFKVFQLDSSNINLWDNTDEYNEASLFDTARVFKLDRSKEDILFEIMLKYGVFDQPESEVEINGKTMYRVGQRHMIVCLEDRIDDNDIAEICKLEHSVVVFKEDGFKDDNAKINAEYNLKKSGVEDVKCI